MTTRDGFTVVETVHGNIVKMLNESKKKDIIRQSQAYVDLNIYQVLTLSAQAFFI